METAKIRQAGYPVRYTFNEFVDRYRYLAAGIKPSHKEDSKISAEKICSAVFGTEQDYQIGITKVFLKTTQETYLEEERQKIINKYILLLQSNIRKWYYRRCFLKLRAAAIVIQKHFRARGYQSRYLTIKCGYLRLQAKLQQRLLTKKFQHIRSTISSLQAMCKGYVFRKIYKKKLIEKKQKMEELVKLKQKEEAELKRKGQKDYKVISEQNYKERMDKLQENNLEKETKTDEIIDELLQGLDDYLAKDEKHFVKNTKKNNSSYEVSRTQTKIGVIKNLPKSYFLSNNFKIFDQLLYYK